MLHLKASSVNVMKSAFDAQQSSSKFNWFLCSWLLSAAESSVKTCLLIFPWICHSMVCEVFTFIYLSCRTWTRLLHVEQLIFWGTWKISIHYLLLLPVLLYNTLKSHMFSLYTTMTYLLESRERFRRRLVMWYVWDFYLISLIWLTQALRSFELIVPTVQLNGDSLSKFFLSLENTYRT